MSGSAFAVTHHAFSSGAGRTSDGNGSHASTLKSPSYTKSVSWQHYRIAGFDRSIQFTCEISASIEIMEDDFVNKAGILKMLDEFIENDFSIKLV